LATRKVLFVDAALLEDADEAPKIAHWGISVELISHLCELDAFKVQRLWWRYKAGQVVFCLA
jgi:hypothetical protein